MSLDPTCRVSDFITKDYLENDDICRFCWSKNAQEYLFENSVDNNSKKMNQLIYKVKIVLDIDLSSVHCYKHPNKVCNTCFTKIDNFYNFKVFCQDSHRKLNKILQSNSDNDSSFLEEAQENVKLEKIDNIPAFDENNSDTMENYFESLQHPENGKDNAEEQPKPEHRSRNSRYKLKRTKYYCNICCFNFEKEDIFFKHIFEAHGIEKDGQYKCFGCEKRFKSKKHRVNHETLFCKGLKDGYGCSICNRFLPKRRVYEAHMKDHRLNKQIELPENIFKCKKCSDQFNSKESLMNHMKTHNVDKKNYICETCGRIFSRQDYLYRHKLTHTGDKPHRCPHCDFRTAQRSSITVHIRRHTGSRPYACAVCPQRCVSASNLRAHSRRHHAPPSFQCAVCPKKFGYKLSLQEHIQTVHEKSQSHPCAHCGAVYSRIRGLKRHVLAKHLSDYKTNSNVNKSNKNPLESFEKGEIDNISDNTKTYFIITDAKLTFPVLSVSESL